VRAVLLADDAAAGEALGEQRGDDLLGAAVVDRHRVVLVALELDVHTGPERGPQIVGDEAGGLGGGGGQLLGMGDQVSVCGHADQRSRRMWKASGGSLG
jgi:hypothetical protein